MLLFLWGDNHKFKTVFEVGKENASEKQQLEKLNQGYSSGWKDRDF